jgi:hypothetical protein
VVNVVRDFHPWSPVLAAGLFFVACGFALTESLSEREAASGFGSVEYNQKDAIKNS